MRPAEFISSGGQKSQSSASAGGITYGVTMKNRETMPAWRADWAFSFSRKTLVKSWNLRLY